MAEMTTSYRLGAVIVVWTVAAILGLTVALFAVGFLGLWVAVGAFAGLGTVLVSGWIGQIAFATDFDALIAKRAEQARARDTTT
ncbi:hypothetical protein [uncultured Roseicyclus sp.]|jgi:hypothetical protein|uniref:hypothetical protein n=1 Tax=uncultured Roseicyclus sp. TaxID=543072 RepID=UPI00260BD4EB|nr:hypothetical protein [uncultured Roseicyclus sp.]